MTTDTYAPSAVGERIRELCRQFRLPTLAAETVGRFSDAGHADALPTLMEVLEQEAEDRRIRRVDRLRRASKLPAGKTWDTFEHERAPVKLRQQLVRLAEGDFVDRGVNVLAFGMPGTGKTHAMCAIGHRLVQSGRSVLFIPAYRLVQDMLAAKRDLDLPRMLRKLDNYDLLVIDDLGYLPQGAGESEVLFTLIAERYERRSLGITSNLVFSEWEKVFANPMVFSEWEKVFANPMATAYWSSTCRATGLPWRRTGRRRMCRTGKSNCRAAKMVVASTYKLSYLCSAESTVREGVKAAKSIDASGKNG